MCSDVVVFHPPPMSRNAQRKRLHALDSVPQLALEKEMSTRLSITKHEIHYFPHIFL